jgi:hypothetical protein
MRIRARLLCPDGTTVDLGPGDLIGRMWSAALPLDDPRISEAHALLSFRGRELRLLALRGPLTVGRRSLQEISLMAGQRIELAPGLSLRVLEVELPTELLGIAGNGLVPQVLPGTCSLLPGGVELQAGAHPDAAATFWNNGEGWRVHLRDQRAPQSLAAGTSFEADGRRFEAMLLPLGATASQPTRLPDTAPLRIVVRYEVAHLYRSEQLLLSLSGVFARLMTELALLGGPAAWEVVANELWEEGDRQLLRHRFDVLLSKLRARLRSAGIRENLIVTSGGGQVELLLLPGDQLDSEGA